MSLSSDFLGGEKKGERKQIKTISLSIPSQSLTNKQASAEAPLPSFAGTPSMASPEKQQARRETVATNANGTFPYLPRGVFGTPVPPGAVANLGSSYYCGPLCMGGSFIAITLTVALMSWACVSLCCGGSRRDGGGPHGSMSSAPAPPQPPPQQQHQQQRPVSAPASSFPPPVALSLRPTRYERFEDAPEEQQQRLPPLRPGSATTTPSSGGAGATNPFASSYPAQPPAAWAPHGPLPPPPAAAWPGHGGR